MHHLSPEAAHWLAVRSMGLNTSLLELLLPGARVVRNRAECVRNCSDRPIMLLDAWSFLKGEARRAAELPPHWGVTSDSIAAAAAVEWQAAELVLAKSTNLPLGITPESASAAGLVDGYFRQVAGKLPLVSWANLREERAFLQAWLTNGVPIGPLPNV
jgi:aspartokinase-like uncharacterized kinase